jgi:hypothetical protein
MAMIDGARWFKKTFGDKIRAKLAGTPFSVDLLTALALQESYEIWGRVYETLTPDQVLELCVGDVIGEPKRGYFPKTKQALLDAARGQEMFDIAHASLVAMAEHAKEYAKYAADASRFCHAFGIFQYDLQFFDDGDAEFFLGRQWRDFDACLTRCITELQRVARKYFPDATALDDTQSMYVAIAYNLGSVNINKGAKQGYFDGNKYYGEYVADYLKIAHDTDVQSDST